MKPIKSGLCCFFSFLIIGCGQQGPLYLPGEKPPIYVPPEERIYVPPKKTQPKKINQEQEQEQE